MRRRLRVSPVPSGKKRGLLARGLHRHLLLHKLKPPPSPRPRHWHRRTDVRLVYRVPQRFSGEVRSDLEEYGVFEKIEYRMNTYFSPMAHAVLHTFSELHDESKKGGS
jgi:hypothetical protein